MPTKPKRNRRWTQMDADGRVESRARKYSPKGDAIWAARPAVFICVYLRPSAVVFLPNCMASAKAGRCRATPIRTMNLKTAIRSATKRHNRRIMILEKRSGKGWNQLPLLVPADSGISPEQGFDFVLLVPLMEKWKEFFCQTNPSKTRLNQTRLSRPNNHSKVFDSFPHCSSLSATLNP